MTVKESKVANRQWDERPDLPVCLASISGNWPDVAVWERGKGGPRLESFGFSDFLDNCSWLIRFHHSGARRFWQAHGFLLLRFPEIRPRIDGGEGKCSHGSPSRGRGGRGRVFQKGREGRLLSCGGNDEAAIGGVGGIRGRTGSTARVSLRRPAADCRDQNRQRTEILSDGDGRVRARAEGSEPSLNALRKLRFHRAGAR